MPGWESFAVVTGGVAFVAVSIPAQCPPRVADVRRRHGLRAVRFIAADPVGRSKPISPLSPASRGVLDVPGEHFAPGATAVDGRAWIGPRSADHGRAAGSTLLMPPGLRLPHLRGEGWS